MKKIFNLLKLGLKNPRYYIESINLSWKHIHLVAFIAMLAMAANITFMGSPTIQQIGQDLSAAVDYLPEYSYTDGELSLEDANKPLYYESSTFQLVIDDSLELNNNQISLTDEQRNLISNQRPFGLFLVENSAIIVLANQIQEVPSYDYLFANPHRLTLFLNYFSENMFRVHAVLFVSFFVSSIVLYWFQMLLISLMAGFFNTRLTRPISFGSRVKMTVIVSFVPLLLLELLTLFIPGFVYSYLMLALITLFIIYRAFRNHTTFIKQIIHTLDDSDVETIQKELEQANKKESHTKKDDEEE